MSWHTGQQLANEPATTLISFNIVGYGATGDGTTNDTEAIQDTINAAIAYGGAVVVVPAGTYVCGDIDISGNDISILGAGDTSIFKQLAGSGDIINTNGADNLSIASIQFLGTVVADGFSEHVHLIKVYGSDNLLIDDCSFNGFRGDGIYFGGTAALHNTNCTVQNSSFDGVNNDNRNGISIIDGADFINR